jgi:hypothetical protein
MVPKYEDFGETMQVDGEDPLAVTTTQASCRRVAATDNQVTHLTFSNETFSHP